MGPLLRGERRREHGCAADPVGGTPASMGPLLRGERRTASCCSASLPVATSFNGAAPSWGAEGLRLCGRLRDGGSGASMGPLLRGERRDAVLLCDSARHIASMGPLLRGERRRSRPQLRRSRRPSLQWGRSFVGSGGAKLRLGEKKSNGALQWGRSFVGSGGPDDLRRIGIEDGHASMGPLRRGERRCLVFRVDRSLERASMGPLLRGERRETNGTR